MGGCWPGPGTGACVRAELGDEELQGNGIKPLLVSLILNGICGSGVGSNATAEEESGWKVERGQMGLEARATYFQ